MKYKPKEVEKIRERVSIRELCKETAFIFYDQKEVCPFCGNPKIRISDEKQVFYCFECKTGGQVVSLVMDRYKIDFGAALRFLKLFGDRKNVSA